MLFGFSCTQRRKEREPLRRISQMGQFREGAPYPQSAKGNKLWWSACPLQYIIEIRVLCNILQLPSFWWGYTRTVYSKGPGQFQAHQHFVHEATDNVRPTKKSMRGGKPAKKNQRGHAFRGNYRCWSAGFCGSRARLVIRLLPGHLGGNEKQKWKLSHQKYKFDFNQLSPWHQTENVALWDDPEQRRRKL